MSIAHADHRKAIKAADAVGAETHAASTKGLRVLLLSRYDRIGSSSRLRHYQFLPLLERNGIHVDVQPLLPNQYLSDLYFEGRKAIQVVARAYIARLWQLVRAGKYDLLWIEKEALPWLPYVCEHSLLRFGPPYVIDFDDAWFHSYGQHRQPVVRMLLGDKLNRLMRHAALVTTGNAYLLSHALRAGAQRVALIPTVVDLSRYSAPAQLAGSDFTVGWIGTPVTSRYLTSVYEPLLRSLNDGPMRLVLVGADGNALESLPVERVDWNEETEVESIKTFNVGIMPLDNTPWERGKCGYKLIQYMACERPVIASPVGVNRDIVDHGVNGFLCETPEEWYRALGTLRNDPELCRRMGKAGRAKVQRLYTLDKAGPQLVELLKAAARNRSMPRTAQ